MNLFYVSSIIELATANKISIIYLTMITTLFQQLPSIYRHLLPNIFNQDIHIEAYADCSNCNMCQPSDIVSDQRFFSPKTKCCTFKPIVPNYLVGGILAEMPHQTKIHDYVDSGQKITPLGYFPSTDELQHYNRIIPDQFGIDESAMCELLVDGNCSIWQHRNAICSTYFCHYFKGHHGKQFWEEVRDFLQMIEELLSNYCCEQLSISPNYLTSATTNFYVNVQSALKNMSPHLALSDQDIWGPWANKRRDFFLECHRICNALSPIDIEQLSPIQYQNKLSKLQDSYSQMMSPTLPESLIFNPKCNVIDFDSEQTFFYVDRLIKLPAVLKTILPLFDGKTTAKTVRQLASDQFGVDMDTAYLIHLYEQDILVGV